MLIRRACALLVLVSAPVLLAQEETPPPEEPFVDWQEVEKLYTPDVIRKMGADEAKLRLQQVSSREAEQRRDALEDFKRGAGLGVTVTTGGDDRVEDARVVDNRIVVTKERTTIPRLMFEFHQLFTQNILTAEGREKARRQIVRCEAQPIECPMIGVGPFVALQTSSESALDAVGVGVMIGLRNDPRKEASFNVGLGVVWDSNIRVLANGFTDGGTLPAGETDVRFKEKSSTSLMLGFSFGF